MLTMEQQRSWAHSSLRFFSVEASTTQHTLKIQKILILLNQVNRLKTKKNVIIRGVLRRQWKIDVKWWEFILAISEYANIGLFFATKKCKWAEKIFREKQPMQSSKHKVNAENQRWQTFKHWIIIFWKSINLASANLCSRDDIVCSQTDLLWLSKISSALNFELFNQHKQESAYKREWKPELRSVVWPFASHAESPSKINRQFKA